MHSPSVDTIKKNVLSFSQNTHTHTGRLPNCSVLTFFSTPQLLPNLRPSLSLGLPHTDQSGGTVSRPVETSRQAGRSTGGIFPFETGTAVNNRPPIQTRNWGFCEPLPELLQLPHPPLPPAPKHKKMSTFAPKLIKDTDSLLSQARCLSPETDYG